ncbi:MAG TPA: OmpA family protein [Polyangiaceae bacterium]|jgi:outer membrane protein OmpA-like peptidoglycan-associated protein|nr:OmpA family protein [Polyangiaceae bacterium]
MNNLRTLGIWALGAAFGATGCMSALPPQDLVTARTAYDRASKGPAKTLDPADLHVAKEQLDVAEAAFQKDGDTQNTRDQAYLATRKAELSEVLARTLSAKQQEATVVNAMHTDQAQAVANTAAELGRTKTQLSAQNVAFAAQGVALKDAQTRAAQAAADLAKFATVKQEARGMVITLSGAVLFTSARSDLSPGAQLKLNDVANALTKEDPVSKMVVEGHTDSQGSAANNQELSQRRAQAVRDYLVTRGIASDRISAQGFGSTRSVADNASPEGRANNRRVEIVVQPTPGQ